MVLRRGPPPGTPTPTRAPALGGGAAGLPCLALRPRGGLVLVVAHGDVVGDRVPEYVGGRVLLADPAAGPTDDDGERALVVDLVRLRRQLELRERAGQAAGELREQDR